MYMSYMYMYMYSVTMPREINLLNFHVYTVIILSCSTVVRQLEQRVKVILDSIATREDRKRELIRGDAVDKAEQLSKSTLFP